MSVFVRHRYFKKISNQGFAYLSLLIFMAILALTVSSLIQVTSLINRRSAEDALLIIGAEYSNALYSYSQYSPPGVEDEPLTLQELLRDTRKPDRVKRHLRQVFPDPVTGSLDWGLVTDPETKRIQGVYSLSENRPIKIGNFSEAYKSFANKLYLRDWIFTAEIGRSIEAGEDAFKSNNNLNNKKFIDPSTLNDPLKKGSSEETPKRNDGLISPNELIK